MIGHTSGLVRTPGKQQNSLKTNVGVRVFPLDFPGLAVRSDDSFTVYENSNSVYDTNNGIYSNDYINSESNDNNEIVIQKEEGHEESIPKQHIIYEGKITLYNSKPPYVETYKLYQGLTPGISKIPITHQPIRGINVDAITNLSSMTSSYTRSDEFHDKNDDLCKDVKNNCCYYVICCGLCCD